MYEGTVAGAIRKMIYKPFGIIILKRFHECRSALLLFAKQFASRADAVLGVFTSVGRRFYYLQNEFSTVHALVSTKIISISLGWELHAAGGKFLEIKAPNLCKNTVF